jgi:hypothetical protein
MELFIPSLIVLVLAGIVCFFVIPQLSPYVLGVVAIIMFCLGIWQHYNMFPYEYSTSAIGALGAVQEYSGFIMIAVVIVGGLVLVSQFFGANPPSVESVLPSTIIPDLGLSNGNSKSIFNLGGNSKSIFNSEVSNPLTALTNMIKKNSGNSNPLTAVTNMFKGNSGIASTSFKTV